MFSEEHENDCSVMLTAYLIKRIPVARLENDVCPPFAM